MRLRTIFVVVTATGLVAAGAPCALAGSQISSGGAVYAPPVQAPPPRPPVAVPALPAAPGLPVALGLPAVPGLPAGAGPPAAPPAPPAAAAVPGATPPADTGGQPFGVVAPAVPPVIVPGAVAKILPNGFAAAPAAAPPAVQQAIFAANQIVGRPYVYGGGHRAFIASGYDCSGAVSFALHGANLLGTPLDSSEFMRWGVRGPGQWITIYSNPGHAYMTVAGIRLDTSAAGDASGLRGPRWRPLLASHRRFKARSLPGL